MGSITNVVSDTRNISKVFLLMLSYIVNNDFILLYTNINLLKKKIQTYIIIMLCVQRTSTFPNFLPNDIPCLSIQEEQTKPSKIRRMESLNSCQHLYPYKSYTNETLGGFQNQYFQEKTTEEYSLKRKIPVGSQPESTNIISSQNILTRKRKNLMHQDADDILEIKIHENVYEAISDDFLSSLVIRDLKPHHVQNREHPELDVKIENKKSVVIYQEPVNLLTQLMHKSSKDNDMEVE